jgi:DNA-binding MarR family transcriptional regulator
MAVEELALRLSGDFEQVVGLLRSLIQPSMLSMTAAATLATLERMGPSRLTGLAAREGVTQPAMTQLVSRLQDAGLVTREPDPADGRVVQVGITDEGRATLARRRARRAERLAGILAQLSQQERAALAAALPALDALASARLDHEPVLV